MRRTCSKHNALSSSDMTCASSKPLDIANDTIHLNATFSRHSCCRTMENFIVIWLDLNVDKSNDDTRNCITYLRCIVNSVQIFVNLDQCVDYLNTVKDEKLFVIVSGSLDQSIVHLIDNMNQITSIYIFSCNEAKHEQLAQHYNKVKGVFTTIETLFNALKIDLQQVNNDQTSISIISSSFIDNLNELDPSFMYSQLLKEILLEDKSDGQKQKQQFMDFCRLRYADNPQELKMIDEFEQNYPHPSPIWWYTRNCFIYAMMNEALRIPNVEVIIKMGFLARDLHKQLEQLYSIVDREQPLIVYRGQGICHVEFEKMQKSRGGLLSFNNFLSTSISRQVGYLFADSVSQNPDLMGILFRLEIDTSMLTTPFASVDKLSYFGNTEKEILFSMHTVFRIGEINQIDGRLYEVQLTLTEDNDQQLTLLAEHIREATQGPTGLHRMGQLLTHMGEFGKAKEIYMTLLETTSKDDQEQFGIFHNQLGFINSKTDDLSSAISHYQQSLNIKLTYLSLDDPQLSSTYTNIGMILKKQGDFDGAKTHFEHALNIHLHAPEPDPLEIATCYHNIGSVFCGQGRYNEALAYYKCALEIKRGYLPPHHPSLAITYNNIGEANRRMGNYPIAFLYYKKTLDIQQKSLPPNHPALATTNNNIAFALDGLHQTQEAIKHAERAVVIGHSSCSSNHSEVQRYQKYLDELRRKV